MASDTAATPDFAAYEALAKLHHAYFLGLQLMVSTREGEAVMGDWMFRLFRRQHHDKFLSSFQKLGLDGLPHAVACAKYHVLSNGVGGVPVEFMPESDTKAWVRFRYPRWMYEGPTICGVTEAVSRGFLRGWYAHNGVSLGNPRLGYVCVSQDMTGEYGLCGYFREYDHDLDESERLRYAPEERPPAYDPDVQPAPPSAEWDAERLAKAKRNYATEYVRNGLCELVAVIGRERTRELAGLAARLIGLQYHAEVRDILGVAEGSLADAAEWVARMARGMGDAVEIEPGEDTYTCRMGSPRIARGLEADEAVLVAEVWQTLFAGGLHSRRQLVDLEVDGDAWRLTRH